MLVTDLLASSVSRQIVGLEPGLRRQKTQHLLRDDLARGEKPSRIAQGGQLQCEAETIMRPASGADVFEIVIRQGEVPEQPQLVGRDRQQGVALAFRENAAFWLPILSVLKTSLFWTRIAPAKSTACQPSGRRDSIGTARRHLRPGLYG